MNNWQQWAIGTVAFMAFVLLLETVSVCPNYELRQCTIRAVVPDARGFIGAKEMTLVRFWDGWDTEIAGNRGQPGDVILAPGRVGTCSLFGIMSGPDPHLVQHD